MATEHFCTLFDFGYLPQGMALRESLERHVKNFVLWVLCMDVEVEEALKKLDLPSIRIIPLRDVETPALLAVKKERSHGEYCWTMSPFLPGFVFDLEPAIERVTYLDADIFLMDSVHQIYHEFERSGRHVLYTEHGYAPEYDQSLKSGRYCVQLLVYRNTGETRKVLEWWGERCLEWCFARHENGRFGDQKYLDSWRDLFPEETHLLEHPEWTLAPWNALRFPLGSSLLFHFHDLRLYLGGGIQVWGEYRIPMPVQLGAYYPYIVSLLRILDLLNHNGITPRLQPSPRWTFRRIVRRIRGRFTYSRCAKLVQNFERQYPIEQVSRG